VEPVVAFLLLVIVIGIVIGARSRDPAPFVGERPALAAGFAVVGALLFASGLLAVGLLSGGVPLAWVLMPARLVGLFVLALPLAITGRLRVPRRVFAWVVLLAVVDVIAISIYTVGAAVNLPVTAVLASQMAPIAAVMAFVLFREKLGRGQVAGLVLMVAGMTALGALQ
jgi:drug/metabolite transporter (DMT)-like permease